MYACTSARLITTHRDAKYSAERAFQASATQIAASPAFSSLDAASKISQRVHEAELQQRTEWRQKLLELVRGKREHGQRTAQHDTAVTANAHQPEIQYHRTSHIPCTERAPCFQQPIGDEQQRRGCGHCQACADRMFCALCSSFSQKLFENIRLSTHVLKQGKEFVAELYLRAVAVAYSAFFSGRSGSQSSVIPDASGQSATGC